MYVVSQLIKWGHWTFLGGVISWMKKGWDAVTWSSSLSSWRESSHKQKLNQLLLDSDGRGGCNVTVKLCICVKQIIATCYSNCHIFIHILHCHKLAHFRIIFHSEVHEYLSTPVSILDAVGETRICIFLTAICYWHCPHSRQSRVYETVECLSICCSVQQQLWCGGFAAEHPTGRRYWLIAGDDAQ